ncbi:hypothetical protein FOZ63_031967 [Perkinsus olseni]|uniref:Uncharacterized protein n=1 Tax=Perkinsus olseni TaxID=32597 RepID=A0A7J6UK69_PEROL|nr:hypothetical protein FOZ63_031967 [Perkinsus olseni]
MTFQMENTKCTVEADREFVTGRISAMYNGDLTTFERVVKSEVILLSTVNINLALCLLAPEIIIWGPLWAVGCFLPQVLLAFTRMPLYIFIILTGARAVERSPTRTRRALFFLFVGCWSIFKVSLELVSEGHPYTLIPLCLIHSIICVALYFPVFPRESRGSFSRFIDLIFPVDVDVEDLNSSSVRVKVAGVADLCGGSTSLPSLRRVELGDIPKVYHARSW